MHDNDLHTLPARARPIPRGVGSWAGPERYEKSAVGSHRVSARGPSAAGHPRTRPGPG